MNVGSVYRCVRKHSHPLLPRRPADPLLTRPSAQIHTLNTYDATHGHLNYHFNSFQPQLAKELNAKKLLEAEYVRRGRLDDGGGVARASERDERQKKFGI